MRRLAGALAALAVAACAHAPGAPPPPAEARPEAKAPPPRPAPRTEPGRAERPAGARAVRPRRAAGEVGIASFYAHRFHGRRTASGARYDMHALTCAHPRAPFGTRLRVTELDGGRSVVVTVNDRGPFVRGRVVDLSLEAARRLGIVERGLAKVRVERLAD